MKWPWQRTPERTPEKRQSTQPFTDAIQAAIAAQAGGNLTGNPLALGALEMAAGAYSRALRALACLRLFRASHRQSGRVSGEALSGGARASI